MSLPQITRRCFSSSIASRAPPPFSSGPAPPRLPKEEQEQYETLQKASTGAFSTPKTTVVVNQSQTASNAPHLKPVINQSPHTEEELISKEANDVAAVNARVEATGDGEELHPDVRRGAKPEFEGERNPKTGEIGGPKNEPLRWGGGVDWSYNGRVTDF
ncbi:putative mitochondrial protein, conserved [Bachmanniomyces sp. S44760]|nr:putative mitochondrial protein, conserved [Bachmanniomyces sp. S44760]